MRIGVERVRAADQGFELAQRELEMSRDRFRAGIADNLEVINAQTSLANARASQVEALAILQRSATESRSCDGQSGNVQMVKIVFLCVSVSSCVSVFETDLARS
jgi:hypothetical protein